MAGESVEARGRGRWTVAQKEEEASWVKISTKEKKPYKERWPLFLKVFKGFLPPVQESSVVLDIGCGPDGLIFYYPQMGTKIGIDPLIDSYALHYDIKNQHGLFKGIGETLPFRDRSITIIFCNNALDHVRDPSGVLVEISRVLIHGGFLLLDVDTHPVLDKFFINKNIYQPPLNEFHPNIFLSKDIILELEQVGFDVLKIKNRAPLPWIRGLIRVLLLKPILDDDKSDIFHISPKSLIGQGILRTIDTPFYPILKTWFSTGLLVLATKK